MQKNLEKPEDHANRNLTVSNKNKCRTPCQGHWYGPGTCWLRNSPAGKYLGVTVAAKFCMSQQRVFIANTAEQLCYVEGDRLTDAITLPFLAPVRPHHEIRA